MANKILSAEVEVAGLYTTENMIKVIGEVKLEYDPVINISPQDEAVLKVNMCSKLLSATGTVRNIDEKSKCKVVFGSRKAIYKYKYKVIKKAGEEDKYEIIVDDKNKPIETADYSGAVKLNLILSEDETKNQAIMLDGSRVSLTVRDINNALNKVSKSMFPRGFAKALMQDKVLVDQFEALDRHAGRLGNEREALEAITESAAFSVPPLYKKLRSQVTDASDKILYFIDYLDPTSYTIPDDVVKALTEHISRTKNRNRN